MPKQINGLEFACARSFGGTKYEATVAAAPMLTSRLQQVEGLIVLFLIWNETYIPNVPAQT
jgi:hypothetical protein